MKTLHTTFAAALLLALGCGARVSKTRAPDGRVGYALNCRNRSQCHAEAGDLCPRGYDVFDATPTVETNVLSGFSGRTQYIVRESALIACR